MTVPRGGYAWWYLDALSDDGSQGMTIIGFVGSVFSPYYARARAKGAAYPQRHCALNVALYGKGGKRWAMTERGQNAIDRGPGFYRIGPSEMTWDGTALTVRIDEITMPVPRRLRGTVRLIPEAIETREHVLDSVGRHRRRPIAPCARAEVTFTSPGRQWSGDAYFDMNVGDRALEDDFQRWDWSRAPVEGGTVVQYDVTPKGGGSGPRLAMRYDRNGGVTDIPPVPSMALPRTFWRLERRVGVQSGGAASVVKTLEDTPFYARSMVNTHLGGTAVTAMHESLSLDRFQSPLVQAMLPFRMPRVFWGGR